MVVSTPAPASPVEPAAPVTPVTPVEPVAPVQELSPIIETPVAPAEPIVPVDNFNQVTQQSENLFSFGTESPGEVKTSEVTMPEPIIVTDYSKQYEPVMPQSVSTAPQQVEFKEVINAIRECANKIEQYGFKIDVEEYDLSNLYQVVFKVEK